MTGLQTMVTALQTMVTALQTMVTALQTMVTALQTMMTPQNRYQKQSDSLFHSMSNLLHNSHIGNNNPNVIISFESRRVVCGKLTPYVDP